MLTYSVADLCSLFEAGEGHVQRADMQSKLVQVLQPIYQIKRVIIKLDDAEREVSSPR